MNHLPLLLVCSFVFSPVFAGGIGAYDTNIGNNATQTAQVQGSVTSVAIGDTAYSQINANNVGRGTNIGNNLDQELNVDGDITSVAIGSNVCSSIHLNSIGSDSCDGLAF